MPPAKNEDAAKTAELEQQLETTKEQALETEKALTDRVDELEREAAETADKHAAELAEVHNTGVVDVPTSERAGGRRIAKERIYRDHNGLRQLVAAVGQPIPDDVDAREDQVMTADEVRDFAQRGPRE